MNVRSVTCFVDTASSIEMAGRLAAEAQAALEGAGLAVQTTRLAMSSLSSEAGDPIERAAALWPVAEAAGFEYLSLGPVRPAVDPGAMDVVDRLPELMCATEGVFAGVVVGEPAHGIQFEAIRRTAAAVREIAHTTPLGFGNLRLAALANVGPHSPFFPAAYHDGGSPAFAIATESADLAVEALGGAASLADARARLVAAVEAAAARIVAAVTPVAGHQGARFAGIDFSLAPFPEETRSIATAVERLGVDRFGAPGTLFVATLLTDCLRQAYYPRCGFNGLMLPVLEDATLAARSIDGLYTVNDLLLYSAVCGTGLDTIPLPGDTSVDELAGILLDVAALALRLNKPLTARLMPIPGARAGDLTEFDFDYFANARVLPTKGYASRRLFELEI